MVQVKVVDLFCGCGGMSFGLHQNGFDIVAGVDQWRPALNTFQLNHPHAQAIAADLESLSPDALQDQLGFEKGELDCLVGGPPCQGFSKNVPAIHRFFDDPRNLLFRRLLDYVESFAPKTVIIENVAEIYNAYGGRVREEITATLAQLGYQTAVQVLFAPDYGVPQRRRRCFFFASRTGKTPQFPEPTFSPTPTLFEAGHPSGWSAMADLPALANGEGYEPMAYNTDPQNDLQAWLRNGNTELYDHISRQLAPRQFARLSALAPGQNIKDLPDELRPKSGYSGAYGRLDFESPAPTITRWVFHPGSGRFGHPRDTRLITIREAARLQTFTDDFRFTGTYIEKAHQVGNAVPPRLMHALAAHIKECLASEAVAELESPAATVGVSGQIEKHPQST